MSCNDMYATARSNAPCATTATRRRHTRARDTAGLPRGRGQRRRAIDPSNTVAVGGQPARRVPPHSRHPRCVGPHRAAAPRTAGSSTASGRRRDRASGPTPTTPERSVPTHRRRHGQAPLTDHRTQIRPLLRHGPPVVPRPDRGGGRNPARGLRPVQAAAGGWVLSRRPCGSRRRRVSVGLDTSSVAAFAGGVVTIEAED